MAALEKCVKPREEGRVLNTPWVVGHLVVGARLVVEVDGLKGAAHLPCVRKETVRGWGREEGGGGGVSRRSAAKEVIGLVEG